ncbi:MAG: hypothetical protein AABO58_22430 [Acidobacteriota bacterium]
MKAIRMLSLCFLLVALAAAAQAANDLTWVKAVGNRWESVATPGQQLKLYTDVIQSPMAIEIKPKKAQNGRVYLVYGDVRGADIWKAEFVGRLVAP